MAHGIWRQHRPDPIRAIWEGANEAQAAGMAPRCQHCGYVGYDVVWHKGYGNHWFAVCANATKCADRASGGN